MSSSKSPLLSDTYFYSSEMIIDKVGLKVKKIIKLKGLKFHLVGKVYKDGER